MHRAPQSGELWLYYACSFIAACHGDWIEMEGEKDLQGERTFNNSYYTVYDQIKIRVYVSYIIYTSLLYTCSIKEDYIVITLQWEIHRELVTCMATGECSNSRHNILEQTSLNSQVWGSAPHLNLDVHIYIYTVASDFEWQWISFHPDETFKKWPTRNTHTVQCRLYIVSSRAVEVKILYTCKKEK